MRVRSYAFFVEELTPKKKLSELPSSSGAGSDAYGICAKYDGDSDEGDWDVIDVDFTPRGWCCCTRS